MLDQISRLCDVACDFGSDPLAARPGECRMEFGRGAVGADHEMFSACARGEARLPFHHRPSGKRKEPGGGPVFRHFMMCEQKRRQRQRRLLAQMERMSDFLVASRSEEHTSELQSLMRISYAVFCLQKKT